MKKFLKIILGATALVVITAIAIMLHWEREQQIDFSNILPKELEHCGDTLNQNRPEYIELKSWFKSHQNGWENTLITYVPASRYTAPNILVNVMIDGVVVNYQTATGSWVQVANQKKLGELINKCKKS